MNEENKMEERVRWNMNVNTVILAGNLTRDPEKRTLAGGGTVAEFGLALNESYTGKNGEKVDRTVFVDLVAWNRVAEVVEEFLKKGSPVLVEGRLQLDAWTTKEGEKRSKLRVRAERVEFLGHKAGGEGGKTGGAQYQSGQKNGSRDGRSNGRSTSARTHQPVPAGVSSGSDADDSGDEPF